MPIPKFEFDDRSAGTPRQPVPVRLACLAANWEPSMFAQFVVGLTDEIGPIVTVYALGGSGKHFGEIHPHDYAQYLKLPQEPLSGALAAIPPNHFVWSDELIESFSDYVDLCLDRETARSTGLHIRWMPDLKGCDNVVSECTDLSLLFEPTSKENRMYLEDGMWTITFGALTTRIKQWKGLTYIHYLLTHPQGVISVRDLEQIIDPPLPTSNDVKVAGVGRKGDWADGKSDENGQVVVDADEELEASDAQSINNYRIDIAKNEKLIEAATQNGNHGEAIRLEMLNAQIKKHVASVTNKKGKPRNVNSPPERRRKRISLAIARTIEKLEKLHPPFAKHLMIHLGSGSNFSYKPAGSVAWTS